MVSIHMMMQTFVAPTIFVNRRAKVSLAIHEHNKQRLSQNVVRKFSLVFGQRQRQMDDQTSTCTEVCLVGGNGVACERSFRLHRTLCFQLLKPPSVRALTWHFLSFDRRSITGFYLGGAAGVCFSSLTPCRSLAPLARPEPGSRSISFLRRRLHMTDAKTGREHGAAISCSSKALLTGSWELQPQKWWGSRKEVVIAGRRQENPNRRAWAMYSMFTVFTYEVRSLFCLFCT